MQNLGVIAKVQSQDAWFSDLVVTDSIEYMLLPICVSDKRTPASQTLLPYVSA